MSVKIPSNSKLFYDYDSFFLSLQWKMITCRQDDVLATAQPGYFWKSTPVGFCACKTSRFLGMHEKEENVSRL